MTSPIDEIDLFNHRTPFLNMSAVLEGTLFFLALFFAWVFEIDLLGSVQFTWTAVWGGLAVLLPLLAFAAVTYYLPFGPFLSIKQHLLDTLGGPLSRCRWYDLILLSILIGICEEALFRGFLQPWLSQWGDVFGLVSSNVIFGLVHPVTKFYAIVAGLIGMVLGISLKYPGNGNLLVPIIAHASYDYLAFLAVVATYRNQQAQKFTQPEASETEAEVAADETQVPADDDRDQADRGNAG